MKFAFAAILAAASGVSAYYGAGNVTYVTEVVDKYVTYCPGPTVITHGSQEYTVTEATTLTITDCPCTITKPVYTSVECSTSAPAPPVYETPVVNPPAATGGYTPAPAPPSAVPTAGAAKAVALSGAGLAGIVGLAAFIL